MQRDLLPIIEGTTVSTKFGDVKTDRNYLYLWIKFERNLGKSNKYINFKYYKYSTYENFLFLPLKIN